jgi:hypothetical protein
VTTIDERGGSSGEAWRRSWWRDAAAGMAPHLWAVGYRGARRATTPVVEGSPPLPRLWVAGGVAGGARGAEGERASESDKESEKKKRHPGPVVRSTA